jgi:1,4-alpha-glucan branching enzyme
MSRIETKRTNGQKKNPIEDFKPLSPHEIKNTEFTLEASSAKSVLLAADFTNWEKSPLPMIKAEKGVWHVVVPLAPGNYSYRYIVDGKWSDDPQCSYRIPNSFGTANATRKVN